ncbi:MAG: radical SAM family heme chaperone HemW [Chloroflexi bacterium]|nr:radical SAM family heme chaperone HemW [Chloroflexota bacterium]
MKKAGIYIHFPFCKSRCTYCDFNTSAGMEKYFANYRDTLLKELNLSGAYLPESLLVNSIYLGGGTPSYFPSQSLIEILKTCRDHFNISPEVEISMEANPADVVEQTARDWQQADINRISLGMQSAQEQELKMLGRRHCFQDVVNAVQVLHNIGIGNISLDLMFGLPRQTLADWQDSVKKALELQPTHLSLYALTIEEDTPLATAIQRGTLPAMDDDLAADMYEWVMDFLGTQGFQQYEISNWAKQEDGYDHRCQHNLLYWRNSSYLGLGVAAHSHLHGWRWANPLSITEYLNAIAAVDNHDKLVFPFPWMEEGHALTPADEMGESAMLGLRLVEEGLRADLFYEKFEKSLFDVYEEQIAELVHLGLLEVIEEVPRAIRLTRRGKLVGNQVFQRFLLD